MANVVLRAARDSAGQCCRKLLARLNAPLSQVDCGAVAHTAIDDAQQRVDGHLGCPLNFIGWKALSRADPSLGEEAQKSPPPSYAARFLES